MPKKYQSPPSDGTNPQLKWLTSIWAGRRFEGHTLKVIHLNEWHILSICIVIIFIAVLAA